MLSHKDLVVYSMLFLNVMYVVVAVGFLRDEPAYLDTLDFWLKAYIGVYLMWRFNPFNTITFNDFDRKLIFSAGMFLFTITVVEVYLKRTVQTVKDTAASVATKVKTDFVPSNYE